MSLSYDSHMEYRAIANREIKLSIIGLDYSFENTNEESIKKIIRKSLNHGINNFYVDNNSKFLINILKEILEDFKIARNEIFIIYSLPINEINHNNLKFYEIIVNSLKKMHLDYVDCILIPKNNVPIYDLCQNINFLIQKGLIKFWGTSEWNYGQIEEALNLCKKLNLFTPFVRLIKNYKYRIMTYSSYSLLNENLLYENYNEESIPELNLDKNNDIIEKLKLIAENHFNCNINQLINAYIIKNENIITCLIKISNIEDFENNIEEFEIYKKLDNHILCEIENILDYHYQKKFEKLEKHKKQYKCQNIPKLNFAKKILIIQILLIFYFQNYPFIYNVFKPEKMIIYNYIRKRYKSILDNLPYYNHTHITNKTIYWCWLQGIKDAPELYLTTLNSIRKNLDNFNLIIITEENVLNYTSFPDYILTKYKNKIISPTHFSDLIRLELLINFGGTWIDASVLITGYTEMFYNKDLFFFQERNPGCIGSNWFITSEKGSPILRTTQYLLYEYWKYRNELYDYYIFHLMLALASEKYKKDINKIPYFSNRIPHRLRDTMLGIILKIYMISF